MNHQPVNETTIHNLCFVVVTLIGCKDYSYEAGPLAIGMASTGSKIKTSKLAQLQWN